MNPNMKGALGNLMRQAQQMQEKLKQAQDEIARLEITGEAGAGMGKGTLTGKHPCRKVEISPDALKEDKGVGEGLVGVGRCPSCRMFFEDEQCRYCTEARKSTGQLCVVEGPADLQAIENNT